MSDKKNIDRLFQEKFKDFEAAPPEFVWENIREVLEEKKKKRVIPLWFRLSGVAAIIVIGLLLGNFYLNEWSTNGAADAPAVTTIPNSTENQPLQTLPTDVTEGGNVIDRRDNPARTINNVVVNGDGKGQAEDKNNTGAFNKYTEDNTSPVIRTRANFGTQDDALVNHNPNKVNNEGGATRAKYDPAQQQENAVVANGATSRKNKGAIKGGKTDVKNNVAPGTAVANNNISDSVNTDSENNPATNNNLRGKHGNTKNNNTVATKGASGNKTGVNVGGITPNSADKRETEPGNKGNWNNNGIAKNTSNPLNNGATKVNKNNSITPLQLSTVVANNNTSTGNRNIYTPNGSDPVNNNKVNQNNGNPQPKDVVANNVNAGKTAVIQGSNNDGNATLNGLANTAIVNNNTNGNTTDFNESLVIDKTVTLADKSIAETVADTAVAPENELEKLLKEQQKGKDAEKDKALADNADKSKWNVKPQLAPVFYNSLSNGSPIDGQFASNTKSYDNDLSIGLGVNYAVTSRITVRSGINTVNLNYATKGVEFYASLNDQTNNIAARSSNANIVVQDQGTSNAPQVFFADKLPTETFNGSMVQKTGYVEVPVEMSYALLNKKFGIDIIGGISTLFLNENNVSVVSTQGYSTNVGKADNLNNIHFSTNVGVGFKYRFFKSFEANFEPMFKYQVNTFSRDAGNFKPYFIGLYSGISFSF